jgi:hypothetical protein
MPDGPDDPAEDDLLYEAWVLIANAYGGRWDEDPEWKAAAVRWRDRWHATLESARRDGEP